MEEVCVESFCKEKIVLLCKKILPDLIAPKMPGSKKKKKKMPAFLPYTTQTENVWHIFVYLRVKLKTTDDCTCAVIPHRASLHTLLQSRSVSARPDCK